MDRDEVRGRIYAKVDEIPTLPVVVPRVLGLIEDEMSRPSDIARAVSRDPVLASRLLKVANSAYYGFSRRIRSLDKAVSLLGLRMVKSLVLSLGFIQTIGTGNIGSDASAKRLWTHSLATATAMERLARRARAPAPGDHLFLVGLLHDLGKIILLAYFRDEFEAVAGGPVEAEQAEDEKAQGRPLERERRILGIDHGSVGAMVLDRWRLPDAIRKPVAAHHSPGTPGDVDRNDLALLRVADALAWDSGAGHDGDLALSRVPVEEIHVLGIDEEDLREVRCYLEEVSEDICDFFRACC